MISCIEGRALAALNSQYSSVSISSLNGCEFWISIEPKGEGKPAEGGLIDISFAIALAREVQRVGALSLL
jgi:hypothetical protein